MLGLGLGGGEVDSGSANRPTADPQRRFIPPAPAELAPHFPQLEILELVGQGGMGAVYKARQKMLDRIVALKILPQDVGRDPAFAERFTREARALARLTHPHIVMVFDFGETDGYYYFLMEYVDGVNLRQSLAGPHRLSPSEALAIVPQVCEALQYAHDQGIVHRDIKPENVLLDKRGQVKIADFGLAKLLGHPAGKLTLTGTQQVMGTPHYMAPEQMEKPLSVDHRADIYSLGVVFYELLTGELPLGRFAPPSQKANVSADLDNVVLRTLEKEPDQRYQQASEVKTAVETASSAPPVAKPPTAGESRPHLHVPFSIKEVYAGFAQASGIIHFDGRELVFEFQVKDDVVGVLRSQVKRIVVPASEITSLDLQSRWFALIHTLELRASELQTLGDLPGSEHGRARLSIARRDLQLAQQLVAEVGRSAGRAFGRAPHTSSPAMPEVTNESAAVERVTTDVRGPAGGLLAIGILNCVTPVILLVAAISAWTIERSQPVTVESSHYSVASPQEVISSDTESARVRVVTKPKLEVVAVRTPQAALLPIWVGLGALVFIAISMATAVVMILGAVRMRRLESYSTSLTACILAVLPIHPWFWIGLPIGIWALVVMARRETISAFRARSRSTLAAQQAAPGPARTVPPKPLSVDRQRVKESLTIPAIGLIVVGITNVLAFFMLWLAALWMGSNHIVALMVLVAPLLAGLFQIKGGVHMLSCRSVGVSMAGAVASVLPASPMVVLSLPLGIWAILVLQRPQVQQLFHAERFGGIPHGGRGWSRGPAVAVVAMFLVLGALTLTAILAAVAYSTLEAPPARTRPTETRPEPTVPALPLPAPQPRPAPGSDLPGPVERAEAGPEEEQPTTGHRRGDSSSESRARPSESRHPGPEVPRPRPR